MTYVKTLLGVAVVGLCLSIVLFQYLCHLTAQINAYECQCLTGATQLTQSSPISTGELCADGLYWNTPPIFCFPNN